MAVTEQQLEDAARTWSESLGIYKEARSRFYDLVVQAQSEGWTTERIWSAQKYASRDDINRILKGHRRST